MKDCCQGVIVVYRRKRKCPRITQKDFEVLMKMKAEIERIRVDRQFKACSTEVALESV